MVKNLFIKQTNCKTRIIISSIANSDNKRFLETAHIYLQDKHS